MGKEVERTILVIQWTKREAVQLGLLPVPGRGRHVLTRGSAGGTLVVRRHVVGVQGLKTALAALLLCLLFLLLVRERLLLALLALSELKHGQLI